MNRALFLACALLASHGLQAQDSPPTLVESIDYNTLIEYGTDRIENTASRNSGNRETVDTGVSSTLDIAVNGANAIVSAVQLRDAYHALDTSDVQYDPAELARGGPQVPTSCGESAECHACYAPATRSINENRVMLGKAWALARSTISFTEQAVAFGDSLAGLHPAAGVGWNTGIKQDVNRSLDTMRASYRRRYHDFITALERGLRQLGECEARYYDERDWYDRYGYLYLSFMQAKYENPDP